MSKQDKKLLFNYIAQMDKVTLSKDRLRFPIKYENRKHFKEFNEDHLNIASEYTQGVKKNQRRNNLDIADIEGTQSRVISHPKKSALKIMMENQEDQIDKLIRKNTNNQIRLIQQDLVLKTQISPSRQRSLPSLPRLPTRMQNNKEDSKYMADNAPQNSFVRVKTQPLEKLQRPLLSQKLSNDVLANIIRFHSNSRNPTFLSNIFLI